ncbi:hypothetical protein pdam_00023395, partial [Pocillopora damicornis]
CGNTRNNYQFLFPRYQDTHNQISIMVMASARWLGVRLDVVASLIVGSVAAATAFVAQDAENERRKQGRFGRQKETKAMLLFKDDGV